MTDLERIKKDVVEMDSRANVCWYDTKVLTKAVRLILEELTADHKTENSSEKPNNCEELNAYRECIKSRSFWDSKHCDGCYFDERCPFDEPKDEPQTERSE